MVLRKYDEKTPLADWRRRALAAIQNYAENTLETSDWRALSNTVNEMGELARLAVNRPAATRKNIKQWAEDMDRLCREME